MKFLELDHEFYEVINQYPTLKDTLKKMDIKVEDIVEGETVLDHFNKRNIAEEEIEIIMNKLNRDVRLYMKKQNPVIPVEVSAEESLKEEE